MLSFLSEVISGKSYTLNFDGSHNNQDNKSGAGCIIRDNQGEFKIAAAYSLTENYPNCNVAIAEAMALLNGLKLAKENNLNINIIRGDSTEVIDYVLNRSRRPAKPPLDNIIRQIVCMIDRNSQSIETVSREANKVADRLASWGCTRLMGSRQLYTTYADLPPRVAELITQDKYRNKMKEADDGEGSSMASNLGKAGAALAGAAMLAYGVSKFFGDSDESDQHYKKKAAKSPWTYTINDDSSYGYNYDDPYNPTTKDVPKYTLNFDGSHINQLQAGGAGCIIRNKKRELVKAASYNLDNLCPIQFNVAIAEAIALRNGLELAKSAEIQLDLIEGDSKEVIDRILGRERRPPGIPFLSQIIQEIRVALNDLFIDPGTQLKLIGREANQVADELASLGSKLGFGMEKIYARDDVLPLKLAQLIEKDKLAMGI